MRGSSSATLSPRVRTECLNDHRYCSGLIRDAASECPCPPSNGAPPAKVQKLKARKPSVTPGNLQKVIDNDPTVLSAPNFEPTPSAPSETSSNGPSISSSTSSTPRTHPIDSRDARSTVTPLSMRSTQDDRRPGSRGLQLGMMGVGGYGASSDVIGWSGEWPDLYGRQQGGPPQSQASESSSSCCSPPRQRPSNIQQQAGQSSCCNPQQIGLPFDADSSAVNPFAPFSDMPMDRSTLPDAGFSDQLNAHFASHIHDAGQLSNGFDRHQCHCGDSCACIGCAMHPQNRTTIEYVRYHNELAMRAQQEQSRLSMPTYPPHTIPYTLNFMGQMNGIPVPYNVHQSHLQPRFSPMHTPDPAYAMAYSGSAPWAFTHPASHPHHTPSAELENFHLYSVPGFGQGEGTNGGNHNHQTFQTPPQPKSRPPQPKLKLSDKQWSTTQTPADAEVNIPEIHRAVAEADSPEDDESTSTLSPSSFLPLSVTLDGCDEGACHCGDGCECPGCLVHRGHDEPGDTTTKTTEKEAEMMNLTKTITT